MKARYISLGPLVDWRRIERPIDFSALFGSNKPLVLEIGFGNGEYLVTRAKEQKHLNFVGLEKEWQSVWRALRKVAQRQLENVQIIKADARWAIYRLFEAKTFHEVYCLFPCPWPKEKHVKYRLFGTSFLRRLNNCIKNDGLLWIITDDSGFAEWVKSQVDDTGFQISEERVSPEGFLTKYGKKWIDEGKSFFYRLLLTKEYDYPEPVLRDEEVKTYRLETFNPEAFRPLPVRNSIVVDFKDYLYDQKQGRVLVRAVVVEDNFVQDFWIEIRKREQDWHIRPASGCGWIPTLGLQRALDAIYEACRYAE